MTKEYTGGAQQCKVIINFTAFGRTQQTVLMRDSEAYRRAEAFPKYKSCNIFSGIKRSVKKTRIILTLHKPKITTRSRNSISEEADTKQKK